MDITKSIENENGQKNSQHFFYVSKDLSDIHKFYFLNLRLAPRFWILEQNRD